MIKEIRLTHEIARSNAINLIRQLPVDSEHPLRVIIDEDKRSNAQNRLMWAMMADLSNQVIWCGKKHPRETWKTLVGFQALKEIAAEDKKEFNADYVQSLDKSTLLSIDVSTRNMIDSFINEMGLDDDERRKFFKLAMMHNITIKVEKLFNNMTCGELGKVSG